MSAQLLDVPLDDLAPHPRNVRRDVGDVTELAESIATLGILEPLLVAPNPHAGQDRIDGDTEAPYVVIAGHRRLAAAQAAALPDVPCIVRADLTTDIQVTLAMLVENLQRTDLSPIEEATAYHQLELAGMTSKDIAKQTGRARSTVDARMRLLDLPDTVKDRVHAHQINLDEAAVLGEFADTPEHMKALERALGTNDWSYQVARVRQRVEADAALAAQKQALTDRGIRITMLEFPTWQIGGQHPEVQNLGDIGHKPVWRAGYTPSPADLPPQHRSVDVDWPTHQGCPGHAIWIDGPHQRGWVCDQADLLHGFGAGRAAPATDDADYDEDDESAAQRAARRAAVEAAQAEAAAHRDALATARTVRLEFLRPLVNGAPGKPLSKYQAAAVAAHLVATLPIQEYALDGQDVLDVLGDDYTDIDVDTLDDRAIDLLAALDPHRALLALIASVEEDGSECDWGWGARYLTDRRRWLRLLESIGYQASDFELHLIADPDAQVVQDVVSDLADYDEHHGAHQ